MNNEIYICELPLPLKFMTLYNYINCIFCGSVYCSVLAPLSWGLKWKNKLATETNCLSSIIQVMYEWTEKSPHIKNNQL